MSEVEKVFTNIFGTFTMRESMELNAIWLKGKIKMPDGRCTSRIATGNEVVIIDGELVDSSIKGDATHVIIGCFGTLANTDFQIICIDKKTTQPITIKL